jgi:hypothetical protein
VKPSETPVSERPLPKVARSSSRRIGLPALVIVASVGLALIFGGLLAQWKGWGEMPASSPSAPPSSAVDATGLRLLSAQHQITDRIPGGAFAITPAFVSFRVSALGNGETVLAHEVAGLAVNFAFDGRSRVAYWRSASAGPGPRTLVIWDASDDSVIELTTIVEDDASTPVWSSDGTKLVFVATGADSSLSPGAPREIRVCPGDHEGERCPPGSLPPPDRARLIAVDVVTQEIRELARYTHDYPLEPVYMDDQVVAGGKESRSAIEWLVLDSRSGRVVARTAASHVFADYRSGGGFVAGFGPRVSPPSEMRVWPARDYRNELVRLSDVIELHVFRPGTTEALVSFATGELRPLELSAGQLQPSPISEDVSPIAFDADGRFLLVRRGAGLALYEAAGKTYRSVGPVHGAGPATQVAGLIHSP